MTALGLFRALAGRFARDRRGGPAVEFALIAPVLLALMFGAADVAHIAYERSDMLGAARSGTQYFVAGGGDAEHARTIIETAWGSRAPDALVVVDRICECGGETAACNLLCPDGAVPAAYAVIELRTRVDGVFLQHTAIATEKVRVR
jgi:hypothetical protein